MLDRNKVTREKVPTWPELGIRNLMPKLRRSPAINKYLPDNIPKGKYLNREFVWGVLYTVVPAYAKKLVDGAVAQRIEQSVKDSERTQTITVKVDFLQKLLDADPV